jgi:polyisoprenoid-binding protein YceI
MKLLSANNYVRNCIKTIILVLFIGIVCAQNASAQSQYKLSASPDNSVKVLGTSNVHDWTMTAQNPVCDAEFVTTSGEIPKALKSFSFSVEARGLKSDHESMDSRTYKTIKADQYPRITFKLSSATITPGQKNKFTISAKGTLTIAGVSKLIIMTVAGELTADNTLTCSGSQKIKLTDYNIDPPSFMLGAMKVKDDLVIRYNLNLKKTTLSAQN